MLKKVLQATAAIAIGTAAYIKIAKLDLQKFPLNTLYPRLYAWRPATAKWLLTSLLYWNCLKPLNKSNSYLIFDQGWDINANYLQQLHKIGFDLVINGPSAFDPHEESMGIRYTRMRFSEYKEKYPNSTLMASIVPGHDVCIYTPYLISIDLLREIQEVGRVADYVLVDLNDKGYPPEFLNSNNITQLCQKAQQKMKSFEKKAKIVFKYGDQTVGDWLSKTEEAKQKFLSGADGVHDSQLYNIESLSQILNKPNLKVITAVDFFKNPSLKTQN